MKLNLRHPLLSVLTATAMCGSSFAMAQTTSILPIPFSSSVAGIAAGSGNTACSSTADIPNQTNQHLGDGCLPSQATLVSLYDTATDAAGNVYLSENGTSVDIRVVYNGGAVFANVLKAANSWIPGFTPVVGRIYTLAGGTASALSPPTGSKVYYCGGITTGPQALDSLGDGCPASQGYIKPRGIAIDKYGNIFVTSNGGGDYIRVIYAGGTQVANLIATETPGVTAQVGYIYKIAGSSGTGYSGDGGLATSAKFSQLRYLAVDGNGNVYASDGTTQSTLSGTSTVVEIAANNVRKIDGTTGIISTFAGQNTCTYSTTNGCPYGNASDGVAAAGALLSGPYALFVDASNNVYIADYYNGKIRVVYEAGTVPGITAITTVGDIYTYAGGGTSTANGTAANQVKFASLYIAGIDLAGNIYAEDGTSHVVWKFDAATANGNVIAGGPGTTTVSKATVNCAGATATVGPISTDSFGDGCPGIQSYLSDTGHVVADPQGNLYLAENGNAVVRKLSYNNVFPATAAGSSTTQPLAFESLIAATLNTEAFHLEGATTSEYADAGNDTCSLAGTLAASTLCVFNVSFTPAHAGQREGGLQLGLATTATPPVNLTTITNLSGVDLASDVAIDAGMQSALGTSLSVTGVGTDLNGNVYVSDSTSNDVLKGASSGTTLSAVITGLKNPGQVAVDGFGNLYVADTGNNRVLETTSTGTTVGTFGTGLSGPKGVAVDGLGTVYIADTGNNRVLQVFADDVQNVIPLTGLTSPTQLVLDAAGDLFVLNSGSSIVELASGTQTTVSLDSAVKPSGLAVDVAGDVYVADSAGQRVLVYPVGASTGTVLVTGLTTPVGLAVDADANVFIADTGATGAMEVRRTLGNITFPLTNVPGSSTAGISLTNVGNSNLSFPTTTLTTQTGSSLFTVASSTTNGCASGAPYTAGTGCSFTATFSPTATGPASASVYFSTNASDATSAYAELSGKGLLLTNTTTTLTVAPSPAIYYGNAVTLTAQLIPATTTTIPTGTFTFVVNGVTQFPSPNVGNGTVTLQLSNLGAGSDSASVTYSGDDTYASSAQTVNFTVNKAVTSTALTVTPVNSAGQLSLTFKAAVASTTATGPTGTVSFYAGGTSGTLIGTVTLTVSSAGVATLTPNPAVLSYSPNSFIAVYSGDSNFATSTSAMYSPVGDFVLGYSATNVAISQGGVGNLSVAVSSLFGGAGTITLSCTGMPANSVCRFQPESLTVGTTQQTEAILFYTNVQSTAALNTHSTGNRGLYLTLGVPVGLLLLFVRRRSTLTVLALLLLGVGALAGLSGCGNGYNASTANKGLTTPAGTYSVNVVYTGSNGLTTTHSVPVAFTVIADSGTF